MLYEDNFEAPHAFSLKKEKSMALKVFFGSGEVILVKMMSWSAGSLGAVIDSLTPRSPSPVVTE